MMTFEELMLRLNEFVVDRNWSEFHTPKNLLMALSAEVGELMEIFQWDNDQSQMEKLNDPEMRAKIEGEFADALLYLLHFANATSIDVQAVAHTKLSENERRFTRERARELSRDRFREHILSRDGGFSGE